MWAVGVDQSVDEVYNFTSKFWVGGVVWVSSIFVHITSHIIHMGC